MKQRVAVLLLTGALLLTSGCASLLDRAFLSVTPHAEHVVAGDDPSILRAETYQSLVSAVRYCVTEGLEKGEIRLYNYTRDVEKDLTAACLEIIQTDPLGAYAVDYMKHDVTRILSYYKVDLTVIYRRTPEQIAGIVNATGSSAIRAELCQTLGEFQTETVLRIGAFSEDKAYIEALLEDAYRETPHAAFGIPASRVTIYPDRGRQRIVEIILTYPEEVATLKAKSQQLKLAADAVVDKALLEGTEKLNMRLYTALRQQADYSVESETCATPYGALVDGGGDSEGLAMAMKLLLQTANSSCTVVLGEDSEGASCYWTILNTPDGPRHMDPRRENYETFSDAAFYEEGFRWDTARYPACGDPIPEETLRLEKNP